MTQRYLSMAVIFAIFVFGTAVYANEQGQSVSPQDALKRLEEGNARFVADNVKHLHDSTARAKETSEHGQHPFATILACSDSRCPVELIFDQGIGDIFAVKVAGNVSGVPQLGSIEYGVAHTGTALVVVLGHTKCGAVTAACTGGGHEGNIESLVQAIAPAVLAAEASSGKTGKDVIEDAIKANVFVQIKALLDGSGILREAVKANKALVVGAVYDITTGKVTFLGEYPKAATPAAEEKPKAEKNKKRNRLLQRKR
ncbi:carbonic anhydrase [Planctomycetales bacterium]|nr:carbonic anhydrase [Planctomycetales bacterium]